MPGNFTARFIGPTVDRGEDTVTEAERNQALLDMTREIAKHQNPVEVAISPSRHKPITLSLHRVQGSAAIVQWYRDAVIQNGKLVGGKVHAISFLLAGSSTFADEAAIAMVESREDPTGRKFPVPPGTFASLRADTRPLLATVCASRDIAADWFFLRVSEALAMAFFEDLGVKGSEEDRQRMNN